MNTKRYVQGLALAVTLCIMCTACGGGGASLGRAALRSGIDDATSAAARILDDFTVVASESATKVPSTLDDALARADDAISAGAKLTAEEQALLASGEKWATFFTRLSGVVKIATGWEANIPEDAVRLVTAKMLREPTAEFRLVVEELEAKLLKNLMCQGARAGLDAEGESQASSSTPIYEAIGMDSNNVEAYLTQGVVDWQGAEEVLEVAGLASDSIALHNSYVASLGDVLDSPTSSIAAANIIYFRNCVLR